LVMRKTDSLTAGRKRDIENSVTIQRGGGEGGTLLGYICGPYISTTRDKMLVVAVRKKLQVREWCTSDFDVRLRLRYAASIFH
jgi:hypothetical protein